MENQDQDTEVDSQLRRSSHLVDGYEEADREQSDGDIPSEGHDREQTEIGHRIEI